MIRSSVLALLDQGVWALTNFTLVAIVAHSVAPEEFGLFAVALSVLVVTSGISVAMSGEPLGIARGQALAAGSADTLPAHTSRALGLVLSVAVLSPIVVLAAVSAFDRPGLSMEGALWVVAAAPVAVIAEGSRSILYGLRRVTNSLAISAAWLGCQTLVAAAMFLLGRWSTTTIFAAWTAGAALGAVAGLATLRTRPGFKGTTSDEWRRRRSFGFEFIATAGAMQALVVLAAATTGLVGSGALRALQTVYGPLNIVIAGLRNVVVPAAAQDNARRSPVRVGVLVSLIAVGMTLALTVVLWLAPSVGGLLMGDSWPGGGSLLGAFALGRVATAAVFGALVVLRALDSTKTSVRLRALSCVALILPFLIFANSGLVIAVWVSSICVSLAAICWWVVAIRVNASQPDRVRQSRSAKGVGA